MATGSKDSSTTASGVDPRMPDQKCGAKCQECDWTCQYVACSVPRDKHWCPTCSTAAGPLVSDLVKAATAQVLTDNHMRLADPPHFGSIPIRTELTVLPRDPDAPLIGWLVKEYSGPAVYLFISGTVQETPVTDKSALQPGTQIAVPGMGGGYHLMEVKTEAWAETADGRLGAFLRFGEDDRQCWVMSSLVNTKVFKFLETPK
jgi:hypothetical protein